jgi:hypothetical protein
MLIRLCDFDCEILFGHCIEAAHTPFYKQLGDGSFGVAGAMTEHLAFGSCLYFLCTGAEPLVNDSVYPPAKISPYLDQSLKTAGMAPILRSLSFEHRVNISDTMSEGQNEWKGVQNLLEMWEYQTRSAECQSFLTANRERAVTRSCSNEEL